MKPLCLVPAGMTAKITWLSLLVTIGSAGSDGNSTRLSLDNYVPKGASPLIATDFVSLSFEFALWPDFAGNESQPNELSQNLMGNLLQFTQAQPILRIGGITQDHILYVADQEQAIVNYWNYDYNTDRPENSTIGPTYWDTFNTLSNLRYIFGLNMCQNGSEALPNLRDEISHSVSRIPQHALYSFELGNEVDAYPSEGLRPSSWGQQQYADEWAYKTRNMGLPDGLRVFAPSYASVDDGPPGYFDAFTLWNSTYRYDRDGLAGDVSQHGYITCTGEPDITLQGSLMNHTNIVQWATPFVELNAFHRRAGRTFTMGETNSICGQGAEGVSDVFGAALWTVDYALYSASKGISRMHFHQGTSYRYGAWQPIDANGTAKGTRPPYYGLAFAAKFLGSSGTTQLLNIDLDTQYLSAYAAYESGKLSRLAVVNLLEYNATSPQGHRPTQRLTFAAPGHSQYIRVEALTAPSSESNTSITLAGVSYDYQKNDGRGVTVSTPSHIVRARDGHFETSIGASEAYILTFL